jgi:hypothetical protein
VLLFPAATSRSGKSIRFVRASFFGPIIFHRNAMPEETASASVRRIHFFGGADFTGGAFVPFFGFFFSLL